ERRQRPHLPHGLLMAMSSTIPAARHKLIESIVDRARGRRRSSVPVPAAPFIRQYFRGVAEEDLAAYPSEELCAIALSHLRFASVRKRNRPIVRVFNAQQERDGWTSPHSIVEIAVDDMPFLVDSLGIVLGQENLAIHLMIHPVLSVRRDRAGRLLEIAGSDADLGNSRRESWQHIQIDRIEDEAG